MAVNANREVSIRTNNKRLNCRRETARRSMPTEILSSIVQLYTKNRI